MKLSIKHADQVVKLSKYLDQNEKLVSRSRAIQKPYTEHIELLEFQTDIVNKAKNAKFFTCELPTGIGKSVMAARVCAERLKHGPCLVICPSAAALGDGASGIINKFVRTFNKLGITPQFGKLNDISLAHDVSFVTPGTFVNLLKTQKTRLLKYMASISQMVIDEAHHFPDDPGKELVVYGQIERVAKKHVKGNVMAMTGTWIRLDGKLVMGKRTPDARITVQEAVDLGRVPPLYACQVITEVVASGVSANGDLYKLKLSPKATIKYLAEITSCISTTYERRPVPFAAFARTKDEAEAIAKLFNKDHKIKMVVMVAATPLDKRKEYVDQITAGTLAGYITCAVGEEALDIPKLGVVHLIRRTKSVVRNMQAIGRALRTSPGKKYALVVDYNTLIDGLQPRFVGICLDEIAKHAGTRSKRKLVNGGPIIEQDNYDDYDENILEFSMSMAEERAILLKRKPNKVDEVKAFLREWAVAGKPRIPGSMKGWADTDADIV